MRIALIVERFEPGSGGVENTAWNVAHELVRRGDSVLVVCRMCAEAPEIELSRVDVPTAWQPLRVWRFSQAAARCAPRGNFDVVYSLSRTLHQDVFRAGGGSHRSYLEARHRGWRRSLRRVSPRHAAALSLERRVFDDETQHIQCNSEMVRGELQRQYGVGQDRLRVIRNGVDLERFRPGDPVGNGKQLRHDLGAGAAPVWLFIGSGFARKGLDTALHALARSDRSDSQLWIAGADAPKPWRKLARGIGVAERVRFLGFRHDVPELLAAADGLLLPTRYDASANVCLEAAATATPVVTSASNGAAEIFSDRRLVIDDAEDVSRVAAALDALDDPGARERHGAAARCDVAEMSWENQTDALRRWFSDISP